MVRTESRQDVFRASGRPKANESALAQNDRSSLCEAEQARKSIVLGQAMHDAIPDWEDLWVDLGGEG